MAKTAPFNWEDPFLLVDQLDEDERLVMESTREFCAEQLMPGILEANRHEKFDRDIKRLIKF